MTPDEGEQHACPAAWLVDEVGRYLAGDDADDDTVGEAGRAAVTHGAQQVNDLLRSAFGAHEVVATELRFTGPRRGARRTVFADEPTPVALLLLCLRLCDQGDEVVVLHHTAGRGTSSRTATWPFGMARAEELTRPPGCPDPTLAALEAVALRTPPPTPTTDPPPWWRGRARRRARASGILRPRRLRVQSNQ